MRSPEQIVVLAAQHRGDETGIRRRFPFAAIEEIRSQAGWFSDVFGARGPAGGRPPVRPHEGEHPRRRGSDVVGREVLVGGKAVRIVGVASREFHGLYAGADMEGYMLLDCGAASRARSTDRPGLMYRTGALQASALGALGPCSRESASTASCRTARRSAPTRSGCE